MGDLREDSQVLLTLDKLVQTKTIKIMREQLPATLFGTGFSATEKGVIKISPDGGDSSVVASQDGTTVEFTDTSTVFSINSPMTLVVSKGVTTLNSAMWLNLVTRA